MTQAWWSSSTTCIFSLRHATADLHLGTADSTSGLHSGAILNSKIRKKKDKKVKIMALHRPRKGHLVTGWGWNRKAEHPLFGGLCWERCTWGNSNCLLLCACPWVMAKTLWILIIGLQIHFSEVVNLQIWNPQLMRVDWISFALPHLMGLEPTGKESWKRRGRKRWTAHQNSSHAAELLYEQAKSG